MVMNCAAANILIAVMFVMVIATSNYLLFLRLKAIYHDKVMVIRFYFLLWLVYVGVAAIQGASKSFMSIGDQCIPSPSFSTAFAIPSAIAALIYPMSVFGAIAYRLYRGALHSLDDQAGVRMQVEMLVMGHHLPTFSKIIFLDGQMYLVAATAIAVIEIIVLLTPSIPAAYHLVVVPPHLSVLSSMAAYLFRHAYSTRRAHSTMSSAVLSPAAHRFNNGHGSPQGLRQQGIVVSIEVNTDMERSPTPVHLWNDASQGTEMEIQRKDQKFDTDVSQTDTV
ncbi:hypothetical protein F5051DRAFT_457013 [Lentinula edodes]|nr:hypothetical protein F5051DRAFT_457013 [Lentinula edodes]